MASIYEAYGRLQERFDAELEAHTRTMLVLRGIKLGLVELDRLEVTETSWTLREAEPSENGVKDGTQKRKAKLSVRPEAAPSEPA